MSDVTHNRAAEPEFSDYFALLKPRVMSLVIFTALVGIIVAPGSIHPMIAFTALLFIAIGAGASGSLNMWYDADIDARMKRTAGRPVPSGRVTADEAFGVGIALSGISVVMLALATNIAAAALLAFTIFFYVVIYTMWLKRLTPQNIVIGGAAGAFPPMVGWMAATGTIAIEPVLMFMLIFVWTPPHFWALALFTKADYANAGVPMLTVTHGREATRRQILIYSVLLVPVALWLALSYYTSAFIAEIVRAGILSVSHGQTEAAYALGLRPGITMRLVIIPQALRVIVPPLTSQYLNLTKNSSLAAAIGYPERVAVCAGTVLNQTGQAVECILMTMAVYFTISLSISVFMNWYNRRIALVER